MKKIYYVAKCYGTRTLPTIFEVFDDYVDAQSYAALMSRTKGVAYMVLEAKELNVPESEKDEYKEWTE
jgi:hypothetical protein